MTNHHILLAARLLQFTLLVSIRWLPTVTASVQAADQGADAVFSTKYSSSYRPESADFYYNGRAVGSGRQGFAVVVSRIRNLPRGASVIWGPNYRRDGTGGGSEYSCVPKRLYPSLWDELEALARKGHVTLSSDYPEPWLRRVPGDDRGDMPAARDDGTLPVDEHFDAVVDWKIGAALSQKEVAKVRFDDFVSRDRQHRFSADDRQFDAYGLDMFFGGLEKSARILVRITTEDTESADSAAAAEGVFEIWNRYLRNSLRMGNLQVTLAAPDQLAAALRKLAGAPRLVIDWSNFHGPETPHEGVLYFINTAYCGRGSEGFERILNAIDQQPEGSQLKLPRYELGGRWAMERIGVGGLRSMNLKLRKIVPFATAREKFDTHVNSRKLHVSFEHSGPLTADPKTVLDWSGGDRVGRSFVSFGRIVRYDERHRRQAKTTRLGWANYDTADRPPPNDSRKRQVENEAQYTVNDAVVGRGVAGFAQAMAALSALKPNSIVQVRVCIRTKPPFTCPITFEGHRHFERTGYEPYFGMFPWLVDVARKHNLLIEWLPDEQASCRDCALNL